MNKWILSFWGIKSCGLSSYVWIYEIPHWESNAYIPYRQKFNIGFPAWGFHNSVSKDVSMLLNLAKNDCLFKMSTHNHYVHTILGYKSVNVKRASVILIFVKNNMALLQVFVGLSNKLEVNLSLFWCYLVIYVIWNMTTFIVIICCTDNIYVLQKAT